MQFRASFNTGLTTRPWHMLAGFLPCWLISSFPSVPALLLVLDVAQHTFAFCGWWKLELVLINDESSPLHRHYTSFWSFWESTLIDLFFLPVHVLVGAPDVAQQILAVCKVVVVELVLKKNNFGCLSTSSWFWGDKPKLTLLIRIEQQRDWRSSFGFIVVGCICSGGK